MKKFALVLSGGGFKGAFQIGALRHLKQNWSLIGSSPPNASGDMKFDIVAGVSVGSLNGVLTASNEFDELEKLWFELGTSVENIYTSDFIDTGNQTDSLKIDLNFNKILKRFLPNIDPRISLWKGLGLVLSKSKREKFIRELLAKAEKDFAANFKNFKAIADNTPLKRRLETIVRRDKIRDCIYKCGFVSLNNGEYYSLKPTDFKTDEDFRNGILASTSMPIVWAPVAKINVVIDGVDHAIDQSVDGGIRNVSPLADVIDEINKDDPESEYTIIIINCNAGVVDYKEYGDANIAGIALRSLSDIAITEIFNNDISEFLRINDIIDQVKSAHPTLRIYNYSYRQGRMNKVLRPFKTIIIQTNPEMLGDPLVANEALNARRLQHGEEKAAEALQIYRQTGKDPALVIV